jgi:hypothetical protein
MAEELKQVIDQLSSLDAKSPASLLTIQSIVSNCCDSFAALDILTSLSGADLHPFTYCYAFECISTRNSPDGWLLSQLAALVKQPANDQKLCINLNDLESVGEVIETSYKPCFCSAVSKLRDCAVVGTLANEEDLLCDSPSEFRLIASRSICGIKTFSSLLCVLLDVQRAVERLRMSQLSNSLKDLVKFTSLRALLVALEHQEQHPWTSPESISDATKLVGIICQANNCTTFESLLLDEDRSGVPLSGYLEPILIEILPKLTGAKWKLNPSMPFVFCYCLHSIGRQYVGEYLPRLLPPALVFVDDHQESNRLLGLRCLRYIIDNCSRTELKWFGRADVIYDSLQRAFYGCEKTLLDQLIMCLFDVLNIIEASPCQTTAIRTVCQHDQLFTRFTILFLFHNFFWCERIAKIVCMVTCRSWSCDSKRRT